MASSFEKNKCIENMEHTPFRPFECGVPTKMASLPLIDNSHEFDAGQLRSAQTNDSKKYPDYCRTLTVRGKLKYIASPKFF